MPIASTGTISFSQIRDEFGGSGQIYMSQYYRGAGRVPNDDFCCESADGGSIPSSGQINFNDFRGTTKGDTYFDYTGTTATVTLPANARRVQATLGGGGGGSLNGYTFRGRGNGLVTHDAIALGGGSGAFIQNAIIRFAPAPGKTATIVAGTGGAAGRISVTTPNYSYCWGATRAGAGGDSRVTISGGDITPVAGGGNGSSFESSPCMSGDNGWGTRLNRILPATRVGRNGAPSGAPGQNGAVGAGGVTCGDWFETSGGTQPNQSGGGGASPNSSFAGAGGGAFTGRRNNSYGERSDAFRNAGGNGRVRVRV